MKNEDLRIQIRNRKESGNFKLNNYQKKRINENKKINKTMNNLNNKIKDTGDILSEMSDEAIDYAN